MPSIALPENNTARVWVDYSDGINQHSIQGRYTAGTSSAPGVLAVFASFLAEIDAKLYAISIIGARQAAANSNVTNPISWPGDAGYGTGAMPAVNAPRQVMWEGKDAFGHRWRLSMFGCNFSTPDTYRLNQGDVTEFDAGRAELGTALANGTMCSIAIHNVLLKLFMSVNFNNHFEAKARP